MKENFKKEETVYTLTNSLGHNRCLFVNSEFKDHIALSDYVGEAMGLSKIDLHEGIFFTIFTSVPGQEQLQISRLQAKPRPRFDDASRRTNTFDPRHFNDNT